MSKGRWSAGLSLLFAAAAAFFIFTGGRAYAAEVICQPEKGEITEDAYVLTLTPEEFFLPVAEESSATLDGQKCGINSVSSASAMAHYAFIWIPVGLLICLTVIAFNFVGDGLRDAYDPKSKR